VEDGTQKRGLKKTQVYMGEKEDAYLIEIGHLLANGESNLVSWKDGGKKRGGRKAQGDNPREGGGNNVTKS